MVAATSTRQPVPSAQLDRIRYEPAAMPTEREHRQIKVLLDEVRSPPATVIGPCPPTRRFAKRSSKLHLDQVIAKEEILNA